MDTRQSGALRALGLLVLIFWTVGFSGCAVGPRLPAERELGRCVWVSRFEYKTRHDIDEIMSRVAAAGFDTVFFQVRGNGTVHFASRNEVWSESYGHASPGFDPLSHAVVAAHAKGLKIHAWLNMVPGWRGEAPPKDRRQIYTAKPGWFMRQPDGRLTREPGGSYTYVNPCLPAVRSYLIGICEEVASGYGIDGIHLDYIRFPDGRGSLVSPGDQRSLATFTRQTQRPVGDTKAFRRWKTGCITELVAGIRRRLQRQPRDLLLTAAVYADLQKAQTTLMQDWPTWTRRGLVDAVIPMNYTHDDSLFESRCRELVKAAGGTPVIMGIGVYKHREANLEPKATMMQMDAAMRIGSRGVALFSYGSSCEGKWADAVSYWNRTRPVGR